MKAILRFANCSADKQAAYRLRYELYVEKQGLFRDEADVDNRWLADGEDAHSHILLADVDGRTVGTVRMTWGSDAPFSTALRKAYDMERFRGVVSERDIVVGSRLLVREEYRGGAVAIQLVAKAVEFAAVRGAPLLLCNCEPHLVSLYERLGFRPYGKLYNHATNGLLVPMVIVTGDFDYLQRIHSPLFGLLQRWPQAMRDLDHLLPPIVQGAAVVSQGHRSVDDYMRVVSLWFANVDGSIRSLLDDLSREETKAILAKSHLLSCSPNDVLIGQGHVSHTLYVLLSGALEVVTDGEIVATVNKPGDIVGEVAFFTGARRMSDVVAGSGGARVLALSDRVLREIVDSQEPVAAKFLHFAARGLCQKLQGSTRREAKGRAEGDVVVRSPNKRRIRNLTDHRFYAPDAARTERRQSGTACAASEAWGPGTLTPTSPTTPTVRTVASCSGSCTRSSASRSAMVRCGSRASRTRRRAGPRRRRRPGVTLGSSTLEGQGLAPGAE